jgi:deoxyribonuclease V
MRELQFRFNSGFSIAKARELQKRLAERVVLEDRLPEKIRFVAGVDVAYVGKTSIGAAVVLDYDSLLPIESQVVRVETRFPYIPTLLSFREIPPTLAAIKKLKTQPDVFLVDGQGVAHPYRLGFASHLGVIMDKPTIGVAKNILCGEVKNMTGKGWAPIVDRGEVVGAAVVIKTKQKPLYVSVGHKVSLERSIEIVKRCVKADRLPEPILRAHRVAGEERRRCKGSRRFRLL